MERLFNPTQYEGCGDASTAPIVVNETLEIELSDGQVISTGPENAHEAKLMYLAGKRSMIGEGIAEFLGARGLRMAGRDTSTVLRIAQMNREIDRL